MICPRLSSTALLALLIILTGLSPVSPMARPAAAESPLTYSIDVSLDYPKGVASVRERVGYTNRTGATLTSVTFNVTPRHFDAFTLTALTVDGKPTQAKTNDVTLEAPLPAPLPPGGRAEIEIDYRLVVPSQSNIRFGRAGGITALGNSFPTVQLFWNGGWTRYPYTDIGDAFFSESADYDVTLDVANAGPQLAVAHSGDLVSRAGNRFVFRGSGIRDFTLALSERYQTRSRTIGATTVTAYYLPEHAAGGAQMLESAAAALAWGNARLGAYPWSSLSVAETTDSSGTGQEYPNAVFIASSALTGGTGAGSYLDYVVAHEVFHQWLYSLVGNDQVRQPWLDEGPTTHLSYLYLKDTAPASYQSMWTNMVQTHRQAVAAYGDRPLDTTIYDYPSDAVYFAILYRKSALFLDEARVKLGDDRYYALLRDYVAANRYGIATTSGFLALLRDRLPAEAPALVGRYFSAATTRAAFGAPTPTVGPITLTATPAATAAPSATPVASPTASSSPSATTTPTWTATVPPAHTPTPTALPSPTPTLAPSPTVAAAASPSSAATPAATTATEPAADPRVAGVRSSGVEVAFATLLVFAAAGGGLLALRLRRR